MGARRAAIYVRISSDRTGRGLGVARQEKRCREKAQALGWDVVEVFTDNDVSASTGKRRPAYEAMLSALRAGRVDAVVVWDLDRLTRRPIEVEHFITLADEQHVALASVGGDFDLSTDNGRMFARIKGAVARGEIERKIERQKVANDQRAEQGRPFMGRRAFGYAAGGMEVVEPEADAYRWAVDEALSGASLRSIAKGLNDRGLTSTAGNPFKPTEVRRLLQNPRHAGLMVHRGEVVGPGVWPPIIDEDTHRAVVAILSDPSRRERGRPRAYLLSGVARCGLCGEHVESRLYGRIERRGPIYVCETAHHMGRKVAPVDAFVAEVIVSRLQQPDAADLFAAPDNSGRLAELRSEERALTARLDGLAESYAAGDIDRRQLTAGTARLRGRLDAIAAELPSLAAAPAVSPLVGSADVRGAWEGLTTESQRSIIDKLVRVTVHPPGRGARVFDPETVQIEWKGLGARLTS